MITITINSSIYTNRNKIVAVFMIITKQLKEVLVSEFQELINYYRENNLRESFETLNTTLRHSYTDKQSYIALHNFEASEPNFLTLVVGQKVYVISRTGEDRGWWKGRSGNRVSYYLN